MICTIYIHKFISVILHEVVVFTSYYHHIRFLKEIVNLKQIVPDEQSAVVASV